MSNRFIIHIILVFIPIISSAEVIENHCSGQHFFETIGLTSHVRDPGLLTYDVIHYGISLEVNDTGTFITGYTDVTARALEPIEELIFELSSNLQIDSVCMGDKIVEEFSHEEDLIKFLVDTQINADEFFKARIYYHGEGGQNSFFAGISNRVDGVWDSRVTYTLSEPFRSLDWFVCKQVLNDKADSADIYIIVEDDLMAGSNGILEETTVLPGNKVQYHWKSRYPVAYYLLSISVSKYMDYSFYTKPGSLIDSLLIQNYIYDVPGYLEENKDDIDATANMIDLYSGLFIPYPFHMEKYGHCLAPIGGGMEHQTMTTLSSFNFNLVAHELTHQWFGDNVTCASWQDIWINEGFASYGEYLAIESLISLPKADEWMNYAHDRALTEPEGSVYIPIEEAEDVLRIFSSSLSYKKGAAILHMIRYELNNDSIFFNTLSRFQEQYTDSVASGHDFLNVLNEVSGSDFDWFFEQWYYGQGFPEFHITWWQTRDSVLIDLWQSGSSDKTPFFRTDIDISLLLENGRDSLFRFSIELDHLKIGIPMDQPVSGLVVDPGNWILNKSQVTRKQNSVGYLSVNPNPFGDELNIVFRSGSGNREISLCDLTGKIIDQKFSTSDATTMNTQHLGQGIYLLKVKEGKDVYTTRVLRQ